MRLLEMERSVGSEVGALGLDAGRGEPEDRAGFERVGGEDFRLGTAEGNQIDVDVLLLALCHRERIDVLFLVAGTGHGKAQLALGHRVDHEQPRGTAQIALADIAREHRTLRLSQ